MVVRDKEGRLVARKRFYLGGPLLVFLIYFFGHLYPWVRACLVRSVAAAREVHGPPSPVPVRLISLPWCLLLTLDRLNTIGPSAPSDPVVPSEGTSQPSDESSNTTR